MTVYIGVDFHPHQQTVAYCDTFDGEIRHQTFKHGDRDQLRSFYQQFDGQTIIGAEATGSLSWFENLLFELDQKLLVGHPKLIRARASSRHKSDTRDAELMLDLLMTNRFPTLWRRSPQSEATLEALRFRHGLVKQRTGICNRLQALAHNHGLPPLKVQTKRGRKLLEEVAVNETSSAMRTSWFSLLDTLDTEISSIERALARKATADTAATLVMTHPGIGTLTGLCLVHTIGDVTRFVRSAQVTAYVGLDPVEKSSGDKARLGSISKAGSKLLRFLLVQAAHSAIKKDDRLRRFYHQVARRRGKPIAKVATARKLLVRTFIMLRDQIDYDEFCRRGTSKLVCTSSHKSQSVLVL